MKITTSSAKNLTIPRRICRTYGFSCTNARRKDSSKRSRRTSGGVDGSACALLPLSGGCFTPFSRGVASYTEDGNTGVCITNTLTQDHHRFSSSVSHRPTTRSDACRTGSPFETCRSRNERSGTSRRKMIRHCI